MKITIRILSAGLFALGFLYLIGFQIFIGKLTAHADWFLPRFFGPGAAQDYGALYAYADQITRHSNFYAHLAHALIGVVIILVGTICFVMARPPGHSK